VAEPLIATGVPPGWYPDPWGQATWRWWSGAAWTAYTDLSAGVAGTGVVAPDPRTRPLRAGGIAILGFVIGLALSTFITVVLVLAGYGIEDPAFLLGSTIGLWIGLFGSCVVAVRVKGTGSLADLGLVRPRWVDAALGVGFGVAGVLMVGAIAAVLEAISEDLLPGGRNDLTDPVDHAGALGILVVYLIAVVGAPFFEELYFRGLVQGTLTARWGIAAGLIVQAVLFGLVHLNPELGLGNVTTFVVIVAVGLGLGGIKQVTGRLAPGMFTHAAYNAIIVTLALFGPELEDSVIRLFS
jgi:membrane protease YdiL (CAAX protease family)